MERDGWEFVSGRANTPKEQWHVNSRGGHWYIPLAEFARERLGAGSGSCLVIGSPIFEAKKLEASGWEITYLDVRPPPVPFHKVIQADATKIPLPDDSFDAVSSSCVLTHAGLGRYGDPLVKNGDELMLAEISRVMKPNTRAAITFGPVISGSPVLMGTVHRIYTIDEAKRMCAKAGLQIKEQKIWSVCLAKWVEIPTTDAKNVDYLSFLLTK